MKVNFRTIARKEHERAVSLLATGCSHDLEIAALKLRKSLEALTYDLAQKYKEDLGAEQMGKWQPQKLLECMLEVDPHADQSSELHAGLEPAPGVEPEFTDFLGKENKISLKAMKKMYHRLGSYLHTPTIRKLESGTGHDLDTMRVKCDEAAEQISEVLSSSVWNVDFPTSGEIECMRCGKPMRRRISKWQDPRKVECWHCHATYNLSVNDEDKVLFVPRENRIPCPTQDCDSVHFVWESDARPGTKIKCESCNEEYVIGIGVFPVRDSPLSEN